MARILVVILLCALASGQSTPSTKVFRSDTPSNTPKEGVALLGNVPVDSRTSYSYERGSQETTTGHRGAAPGWSPYESVHGGSNPMALGVGGGVEQAVLPPVNNFALQPPSPVGNVGVGSFGGGSVLGPGQELGYGLANAPGGLRGM